MIETRKLGWGLAALVVAGNMMGSGDLSTTDQTRASACDSRLSKSGGAVGVLSSSPKPSAHVGWAMARWISWSRRFFFGHTPDRDW